jgi:hypothetical protein
LSAADEPTRKQALADWLRDRAADRPSAVHAEKQRQLFAAFSEFVTREGGWVVSAPGQKLVRFEVPQFSSLPIRLAEKGFKLSYVGASATRNTSAGTIPVDVIELKLPGR